MQPYTHPSGIDLSSIPGTQDIDAKPPEEPEPTVKGVLRALAKELNAWMRCEVDEYISACQNMEGEKAARIPDRYKVLSDVYDLISRMWQSCEFDGDPQPAKHYQVFRSHMWDVLKERNDDAAV